MTPFFYRCGSRRLQGAGHNLQVLTQSFCPCLSVHRPPVQGRAWSPFLWGDVGRFCLLVLLQFVIFLLLVAALSFTFLVQVSVCQFRTMGDNAIFALSSHPTYFSLDSCSESSRSTSNISCLFLTVVTTAVGLVVLTHQVPFARYSVGFYTVPATGLTTARAPQGYSYLRSSAGNSWVSPEQPWMRRGASFPSNDNVLSLDADSRLSSNEEGFEATTQDVPQADNTRAALYILGGFFALLTGLGALRNRSLGPAAEDPNHDSPLKVESQLHCILLSSPETSGKPRMAVDGVWQEGEQPPAWRVCTDGR